MKDTFKQAAKACYGEIVKKDCCLFRQWGCDFFDYIIDIGANVGIFSNYAHMRHPRAKIFAYEPSKETFDLLIENFGFMDNVVFVNSALGTGDPVFFCDNEWSGCNQFFTEDEVKKIKSVKGYQSSSVTLSNIFSQHKIPVDSNYFIKIDCEGGERFLLNDKECVDIIKKSCGTSMEVHFPQTRGKPNQIAARFKSLPPWCEYNKWIQGNFSGTHNIVYHFSNGAKGYGIYVLTRKQL